MPEHGLNWLSRKEIMSYEELMRTCSLLVKMGIEKIRITGGEPFVRKDMMKFLTSLSNLPGLNTLTLTTNGVLTAPLVPELKKIGIRSVNLSLDTLDRDRFKSITYRDELPSVLQTLEQLLKYQVEVKINAVVMADKNIEDIIPLVALTKELPVSVRFIEEMPFNGKGDYKKHIHWDQFRILNHIKEQFNNIEKIPDPLYSTSYNYHIPGYKGNIGIIAAYTRTFCGTCNRIRITPEGSLKTCLYDTGGLNIKDMLRKGMLDNDIEDAILNALSQKAKDGWEAEKIRTKDHVAFESMAAIGG
jgi:cyclic pyranopterin phosphate synthase